MKTLYRKIYLFKMGQQLQIPLFSPEVMAKQKEAYREMELEKLRKQVQHLKHQRAGHIGAYNKLKKSI